MLVSLTGEGIGSSGDCGYWEYDASGVCGAAAARV